MIKNNSLSIQKPNFFIAMISLLLFILLPTQALAIRSVKSHNPEEFVKSLKNDPHAGQKVYHFYCSQCHALKPNIPIGAPRIGIKADWQQRAEKGINNLLIVTTNGLNQMPPRGGCFECSDDLLKKAIIFMLPHQQTSSTNKTKNKK